MNSPEEFDKPHRRRLIKVSAGRPLPGITFPVLSRDEPTWLSEEDRGLVTGGPGRCSSLGIDRARRPDVLPLQKKQSASKSVALSVAPADKGMCFPVDMHPVCYHTFREASIVSF
ncbi:hypothetical protein VZT92_027818 [Zoarces viviparus]|uniref:Uncharacterized protein n=1 Tax=Zoarces viviparus TaxID=48416 RepID=A0AAW1DWN0_ZOAVI